MAEDGSSLGSQSLFFSPSDLIVEIFEKTVMIKSHANNNSNNNNYDSRNGNDYSNNNVNNNSRICVVIAQTFRNRFFFNHFQYCFLYLLIASLTIFFFFFFFFLVLFEIKGMLQEEALISHIDLIRLPRPYHQIRSVRQAR